MKVILKKPYEISLWEDISEGNGGSFKEKLVGIIGSNTMDTPIRATNPIFSTNVNGVKTLTFSMFATYLEEESNNILSNPFLKFLVNERKVKLKYDNKWYDFIIKDINENSSNNTFTYTAKDAQIDELSKTGFQIELTPELYNNQGTVVDLAAQVLEGSDWKINLTEESYNNFVEENSSLKKYVISDSETPQSEIIRQTIDEPLFKIVLEQNITANELFTNEEFIIPEGQVIYGFYETILNQEPYFQFIYNSAYNNNNPYPTNDERVILESDEGPIYYVYKGEMSYQKKEGVYYPIPIITKESEIPEISKKYRGERYIRHQKVRLDPKIDKYVEVYKDQEDNDIYCFEETEYIASDMVQSIITNGKDFMSDSGWSIEEGLIKPEMSPDPKDMPFGQVASSFLKMQFNNNQSKALNTGIRDHRSKIETIKKDEEYIFRIKYGIGNEKPFPNLVESNPKLSLKIAEYKLTDTGTVLTKVYFDFKGNQLSGESVLDDDGFKYYYTSAKAIDSLSLHEMVKKKIGIFLFPESSSVGLVKYWIKDIQVFPKHIVNEKIVVPGVTPESLITTTKYYYNPNEDYNDINDLKFLSDDSELYEKVYNSDFVKIRNITAAESNRYNLLQSLAETFECWIKFTIKHDLNTGEILRDADGRLEKYISFHKFVGQDNHIGFKYGINLNSINRKLASDQIVSKLIVKPNSNQFGEDGFTTIARAPNNPTKDNFLINFRHYIQQGLLDYDEVYDDLYNMGEGSIGYYARLRDINTRRDELIQEQSLLKRRLLSLNSDFQAYSLIRDEAAQGIIDSKEELENYSGFRYQNFFESETNIATYRAAMKAYEDKQVRKIFTDIHSNQRIYDNYAAIVEKLEVVLKGNEDYVGIEDQIKAIDGVLKEQTDEKRELDQKFYNKYSTFLKEGSWISEDYIDDNLYYLDAESVLYTSAAPQVAYTIDVLELSQLEDYKDFKFQLGDRTYVEDIEFFGWSNKHDVKTPYQEDIVISEITYNLDSPENNKIVVQNYQGEFESLFQRITAMTQAIQYQSGAYARAAKLVNSDGTLKNEVLQRSFSNNELILSNARDQSVIWDDTGITISNENRPNEIVRLVNQGILLTQDGGETWQVGITGSGINANYLNAGQIDTSEINIISGKHVAFRWDATGLNSYAKETAGEETWFVTNRFIRFDQHGLYSFSGDDNFEPDSISDILNNSGVGFALTREGFFFQSPTDATQSHYRYVTLDSNDGLVLTDYEEINGVGLEVEKVKAGILYTNDLGKSIYGLRLRDDENQIVLEQTEKGTLYLSNLLEIGPNTELASGEAYYDPRVQFGLIGNTIGEGENSYHKILNINNLSGRSVLRMYDNGLLEAENVNLAGHIEATSGKIGGVSIGDVATTAQQAKGIKIISEQGTVLKLRGNQTSPESLLLKTELNSINPINPIGGYVWEASSDFRSWDIIDSNKNGPEIELTYDELFHFFDNYGRCYIRVSIKEEVDENTDKTYTDFISISTLSDGQEAQIVSLSTSNQIFIKKKNEENFSPDFTMVHSRLQNIGNPELLVWSYWTDDQLEENATIVLDEGYSDSGISRSGSSVRVYPDIFTSRVIIKVSYKDQIEDYITILKLEDGVQGVDGQDAYNVILNNESHTFLGGLEKAKIGETVILQPVAYRGATKLEDVIIPTDSIVLDNSNDFDVSYFNGGAILETTANTPLRGVLDIPVKITDGDTIVDDIILTFSYAVALRGEKGELGVIVQDDEPDDMLVWIDTSEQYLPVITDGRGISSITEHYKTSSDKSTPPPSPFDGTSGTEWSTSVPTVTYDKPYLWNYEKVNYTDGIEYTAPKMIGMYSHSIKSIHNYYLISADGVGITNDLENVDWGERDPKPVPTPTEQKPFLWNFEEIVFEDENAPNHITEARILSKFGKDGDNARLLYLSANSQTVSTDGENVFTPDLQTITLVANTQNIDTNLNEISFFAKGYPDDGTEINLNSINQKQKELIVSNNPEINMWKENYKSVVVTATCDGLSDTITIVRLKDGENNIVGSLTNENITLRAQSNGFIPLEIFNRAAGEFEVYQGLNKITSGVLYEVGEVINCEVDLNEDNGKYKVVNWLGEDNSAKATFTATYKDVVITKVLTLTRARDTVGIDELKEYYYLSENSEGVTREEDNGVPIVWHSTVENTTKSKPYLWNYEEIIYYGGKANTFTQPRIVSRYSEDGRSLISLINYYYVSVTKDEELPITGSPEWTTEYQEITQEKPYLWNYEVATFDRPKPGTDDEYTTETIPMIIGVHGKDGTDGKDGKDGTSITIIDSFDSINDLPATAEDGDAYIVDGDMWVWINNQFKNVGRIEGPAGESNYLHVRYSNNGTTFTANQGKALGKWIGICVTNSKTAPTTFSTYDWQKFIGEDGPQGPKGDTGPAGPQYILDLPYNSIMKQYDPETNITNFSPEVMPLSFQKYTNEVMKKLEKEEYEADFFVLQEDSTITGNSVWVQLNFLKGSNYIYFSDTGKEWRINFSLFATGALPENLSASEIGLFNNIQDRINQEEDINFKVQFSITSENVTLDDYIVVKNGFPKGMTTFAINAASIDAAVRETKLKFSADGLAIYNGGIKIYKGGINSEEVFYADTSGNLHLKGYINAIGGTFKGVFTNEDNEDLNHLIGEKVSPSDLSILGRTTIHGGNIRTDSIAADKINVNSLSAISANLGSISGGTLNINNRFKVSSLGYLTATGATLSGNIQAKSIVDDGGNFAQIGRVIPGQGGSGLGILVGENESGRGDQFLWSFVTDLNETSTTEYGAGLFLKNRVNPYFAAMPNQGGSLVTDGEKNRIILYRSGNTVFYDAKGDIRLYLSNLTSKDTYLQSDTYRNKIGVDNTGPYLTRGGTKRYVFVSYGTSTPTNLANGEIYVQY